MTISEDKREEVLRGAVNAKQFSYSPYSKFRVGAAVLCGDGTIISGCNVENASYGLTICAERTAIVKAVSSGYPRPFLAVAVAADTEKEVWPCGACRQFLAEFNLDMKVYSVVGGTSVVDQYKETTVRELLPLAFTPADLENDKD